MSKNPLSKSQGGAPFMKGLTLSFEGVLGSNGRRDSNSSIDANEREGIFFYFYMTLYT